MDVVSDVSRHTEKIPQTFGEPSITLAAKNTKELFSVSGDKSVHKNGEPPQIDEATDAGNGVTSPPETQPIITTSNKVWDEFTVKYTAGTPPSNEENSMAFVNDLI